MLYNEKKQQIIDAAIDLFAARGIAKVSDVKIATAIDATKGKIYHHFKKKRKIVAAILQMYEDCISSCIPDPSKWKAADADAEKILFGLFFQFPSDESLRLRKIVRIIMSEMYHDEQIANHAMNHFIIGREKMLADCFRALADNGKISATEVESFARFFNRYLLVCAIEDALRYPYADDEEKAKAVQERTVRDFTAFINCILLKH